MRMSAEYSGLGADTSDRTTWKQAAPHASGMGSSPVVFAQLRPGEWVVAVGDSTVGRVRGDYAAGFQGRLDDGQWLPAVHAELSVAAEVLALEASLRGKA